jgi:hypothetical protein
MRMKKIFSLFAIALFAISAVAQTNLFDPAAAYIPEGGTYFATGPNWEVETNSSATYDATTGTLLVDLKSQFSSQWQAQVKLQHNMVFDPAKQYTLSIKFHATDAVGGVTIKMDDSDPALLFQQVDLPANEDYVYTSAPCYGVAGTNQVLVFDFGWAPPCQITISEITVHEVEPQPVEGTELFDPAAATFDSYYFAPNWAEDGVSSASYDPATGIISVDIKSQLLGQWQGQVKIKHNVLFDPAKQYVFSAKFHATAAIGGVTVKMDDNVAPVYDNQINLPANADFVYISAPGNGVEGNNQILVFDFGYAGPCQVTISEISIKEVGEAVAPPVVEHPAAAPAPTHDAAQVFSIYSDAYTSTVARVTGGWGQSTTEEEVELAAGDKAFYYTNCNYLGWEFNGSTTIGDMTAYPKLHLDIYVAEAASIKFTPIWGGEALKDYALQAGWNAIDINLVTEFVGINLTNIIQVKWDAMPATCYIDNVYFYGEGTGVDNITMDQHAVKRIENGQLIIIRDGVKYDITGSVIR